MTRFVLFGVGILFAGCDLAPPSTPLPDPAWEQCPRAIEAQCEIASTQDMAFNVLRILSPCGGDLVEIRDGEFTCPFDRNRVAIGGVSGWPVYVDLPTAGWTIERCEEGRVTHVWRAAHGSDGVVHLDTSAPCPPGGCQWLAPDPCTVDVDERVQ